MSRNDPECCTDRCERPAPAAPAAQAGVCAQCRKKGKSVSTLTVKSLVKDHTQVSPGTYFFCRTPNCEVVYFSEEALFWKPDLKVRVGVKETEDPVPLCYCFDYSRADIRKDMEEKGSTDIPERIKAEVQAGYCACEVKNPSGSCCLGDITRAIQEVRDSAVLSLGGTFSPPRHRGTEVNTKVLAVEGER